jgi:thiol-disulfide isomerase/thioredoxin
MIVNRFSFIVAILFITIAANSQTKPVVKKTTPTVAGTNITVTIAPYKNTYLYLGSYYGKGKTLVDSVLVDGTSKGVFKPKKKYVPGVYFMVSPKYAILFEFIMDAKQQFSIVADTLLLQKEFPVITGSIDNTLFKEYTTVSSAKGSAINQLTDALKNATTKTDSANIRNKIETLSNELEAFKKNIVKTHPQSIMAMLFNTMQMPITPAIPIKNGKADSLYPYRFVKENYFNNVAFNDDRLLRTPFFENKLDNYFKYYVSPDPDSIFAELNYMLLYARSNTEMYAYLLTKFTNKYINPEYMGQDRVFVKLFENFYAKGDTVLLNPASRKTIIDRAYSLMANQLGNAAPVLNLTDTAGAKKDMYALNGAFTFVVFWDPTCGHCKEELPRIDSIYKAKWKANGVKVYSVNINEPQMKEYKQFIQEKNLSKDWQFVYQPKAEKDADAAAGRPNFRQLYDIFKTPTYYLLDGKKNIIAKQLTIEQFNELIDAKLKSKNQ